MKKMLLLGAGAMLGLSFVTVKPARAGSPPNAAVQGTWTIGSSVGDGGYTVAAGTLTFDGNGGVTGVLNINDDGTYCLGTGLSGTYTVNPGKLSGTATMTLSSVDTNDCDDNGDGDTVTLAFTLSNNMKNFNYTEIDPNLSGFLPFDFDGALAGPGVHF
jgi:hypothetical protein